MTKIFKKLLWRQQTIEKKIANFAKEDLLALCIIKVIDLLIEEEELSNFILFILFNFIERNCELFNKMRNLEHYGEIVHFWFYLLYILLLSSHQLWLWVFFLDFSQRKVENSKSFHFVDVSLGPVTVALFSLSLFTHLLFDYEKAKIYFSQSFLVSKLIELFILIIAIFIIIF